MKPVTKILNDRDKILFEKALKFYFFARQRGVSTLPEDLARRISYSGTVAYSLIITFVKENALKIEYMDFLNQEWKHLRSVEPAFFNDLQVKPDEIDELELSETVELNFFDEDEGLYLLLRYIPENNTVTLAPGSRT